MENAIKNKIPIDIDLEPNRDEIYSGICIKQNENVFILVCINEETKEYDGYAILRNNEIEKYRYLKETELAEIKRNNFDEFDNRLPVSKMNTFYDCLKELKSKELLTIFKENDDNSYFVGRIESLNKKEVNLKTISEKSEWIENEIIRIDEISYIGFDSSYEKELINSLNSKK